MTDYVALIIAYRDADLVARVLEQIAAQTVPPTRVLVVDNGGTLTSEQLRQWDCADRSTLISLPDNPGYGAAVNQARPHLGDSPLLVLTHDAEFGPEVAAALLDGLASDARASSVGPLLYRGADRARLFSAGGRLTRGGRGVHWDRPLSAAPYRVDWLDGAIVMYAAAALDAIDWLAEDYFLYFEDVDTGWRLSRAGWRNLVVPQAVAYQEPGAHPPYLGIRNMTLFAKRASVPLHRHLLAVTARIGSETLSRLRHGRAPEILAALRGWRDGRAGLSGKPQTGLSPSTPRLAPESATPRPPRRARADGSAHSRDTVDPQSAA